MRFEEGVDNRRRYRVFGPSDRSDLPPDRLSSRSTVTSAAFGPMEEFWGHNWSPLADQSAFVPTEPTIFVIDSDPTLIGSVSSLGRSMALDVQAFDSGEQFLRQFDPERPGCLILEVHLPGLSGLDIQQRLGALPISPPIIFAAAGADVPTVVRAKLGGAIHFLLKQTFSETEMWEAIQSALDCDAANRAAHRRREAQLDGLSRLTGPERQVLDLLLDGKSNRHIAEMLGVTRRAAESRRARLMRKLGLNSLPDLVRFGIDVGLDASRDGRAEK